MKTMFRQGDVMLIRVADIPKAAKKVLRDNGRLVLAYGEVTGHAHVIDAPEQDAMMLTVEQSATFVKLTRKAQLLHEEHAAITLDPGLYEVRRQREYRPWGEVRVAD